MNLAPRKAALPPLPPTRFTEPRRAAAQPPRPPKVASAAEQTHAQASEIESRQKLWRWLIVVALGVLLLETLIAGKLSRAVTAVPEPQP